MGANTGTIWSMHGYAWRVAASTVPWLCFNCCVHTTDRFSRCDSRCACMIERCVLKSQCMCTGSDELSGVVTRVHKRGGVMRLDLGHNSFLIYTHLTPASWEPV